MNNRIANHSKYIADRLEKANIQFALEYFYPSARDIAAGNFGYQTLVTQDVVALISDSDKKGQMFYALSFNAVDTFLKENFIEEELENIPSFIIVRDLRCFANIITNKKTIRMFEAAIQEKIKQSRL